MIVCDFCKKPSDNIQTIILYTKSLDYCNESECKEKAKQIKRAMKHSIKYYQSEADRDIREAEINIIRRYR